MGLAHLFSQGTQNSFIAELLFLWFSLIVQEMPFKDVLNITVHEHIFDKMWLFTLKERVVIGHHILGDRVVGDTSKPPVKVKVEL